MIRPLLGVLPVLAACLAGAAPQDKPKSDVVRITQRRSAVLNEEKDVQKVAIGDAGIVDVVTVKKRELLLNARAPGRTNMIIWYADESRVERVVQVEHDLQPLRESLAALDKNLDIETASDGRFLLLRGHVDTAETARIALDLARRYAEAGTGEDSPPPAAPGAPAARPARPEPAPSTKVLSLVTFKDAGPTLADRLLETIRPYSADLKVQKMSAGAGELPETFVLDGTVSTQTALTQMLIVVDRMLGGPGSEFRVVANEGGGLHGSAAVAQPPAPDGPSGGQFVRGILSSSPLTSPQSLSPNNLNSNIARSAALMGKTGRWVSFVRVRAHPQVQVSVRILDLDRDKVRTLGVDWALNIQNRFSVPGQFVQRVDAMSIVDGLFKNTLTVIDKKSLLTNVITALETNGYARTLSEPNLATLSGETATFMVGGDVPIQTLSATNQSTFSGFSFREFGIRLTIRPQVSEDGRTITLDLNPDVSDVVPATGSDAAPSFKRTSLISTARLKDGEGLILGGLIGKKESRTRDQVPFLGDIPLLGYLFSRTSDEETQREIAVILLPKIIYPKPSTAFALEVPPSDFPIRGGVFLDPDLGTLPSVPEFFYKNAGEGERK